MEQQELIAKLSERTHYTKREIRTLLRTLVLIIREELSSGHDVVINGLGAFRNVAGKARRSGLNGRTKGLRGKPIVQIVETPATRRVRFYPAGVLVKAAKASMRLFTENLSKKFGLPKEKGMEKYAVKIDPKKVEKEKKAGAGNTVAHPNTNVPHDPKEGTKPYETNPDKKEG